MRARSRTALLGTVYFVLALTVLAVTLETHCALAQTPPSADSKTAPVTIHVVRAGESLWSIAALRLGNSRLWSFIYRANRDQIMDPAQIFVGQRLSIPQLSEEEKKAALSSSTLPQTLKPVLALPAPTEVSPPTSTNSAEGTVLPSPSTTTTPSTPEANPAASQAPATQSPSVLPTTDSPATPAEPKPEPPLSSAPAAAP